MKLTLKGVVFSFFVSDQGVLHSSFASVRDPDFMIVHSSTLVSICWTLLLCACVELQM